MFDEILASFSEDELLSFLPRSSISFLNMLNGSDEAVLAKSDLVNIVKNFIGSDFVFEKKLCMQGMPFRPCSTRVARKH